MRFGEIQGLQKDCVFEDHIKVMSIGTGTPPVTASIALIYRIGTDSHSSSG